MSYYLHQIYHTKLLTFSYETANGIRAESVGTLRQVGESAGVVSTFDLPKICINTQIPNIEYML